MTGLRPPMENERNNFNSLRTGSFCPILVTEDEKEEDTTGTLNIEV
jgi:hypothetical protein